MIVISCVPVQSGPGEWSGVMLITAAIHLVELGAVSESLTEPLGYHYQHSVVGSTSLVQAMRQHEIVQLLVGRAQLPFIWGSFAAAHPVGDGARSTALVRWEHIAVASPKEIQ